MPAHQIVLFALIVGCYGSMVAGICIRGFYLRKNGLRKMERSFTLGSSILKCVSSSGMLSIYVNDDCVLSSSRPVDLVMRKSIETKEGLLKVYYNGGSAVLDISLNGKAVTSWPFGPVERICVLLTTFVPLCFMVLMVAYVLWRELSKLH